MGCRYNFIVDGTLSNRKYFKLIFKKLKELGYQIIIMFVDVRSNIALNRCMLRYWNTKRFIPKETILRSIETSKESYLSFLFRTQQ